MDERPRPPFSTGSFPPHRLHPAPRPEYPAIFPPLSSAYSISATSSSSALNSSSFPTSFASTSSQPYSPPTASHFPALRSGIPPIRTRSRSPTFPADTTSAHRSPSTRGRASSLPHPSSNSRVQGTRPTSAGSDSSALKPFVSKLWFLLSSPERYGDLITWDASGTTILVAYQHPRFINEVLPLSFSHSSVAAFRRQLNIYSFNHLSSADTIPLVTHSSLDTSARSADAAGWTHPHFTRDDPSTLPLLVPKMSRARKLLKMAKTEREGDRRGELEGEDEEGRERRGGSEGIDDDEAR